MKISFNWLKEYVDIPADLKLAELGLKLTMSTVEVEEIISLADAYANMVIGQVKEIVKHPNADKLQVVEVAIGQTKRVSIVCGGTNLRVDMMVVVALPGARVRWHGQGELVTLEATTIRGASSHGMICAAEEVNLQHLFPQSSDKEIIDLVGGNWRPGQTVAEALQLDDYIFVIDNKSLTNRPDLWSHYGIAREVAAILGGKLKPLDVKAILGGKGINLMVKNEIPELCPRYQAVAMRGIRVESSPVWLKQRLQAVGVRPINNIVDITNYIMLATGQPLHAFSVNKVVDNSIVVRTAVAGEKLKTLDGENRILSSEDIVIADPEKVIALGGVMGGANSEVDSSTETIIIEAANFKATNTRRTAVRLGLRTEASARFEKSLDPEMTADALSLAVDMITNLCADCQVASKIIDIYKKKAAPVIIQVEADWIRQRIGIDIKDADITNILKKLKFIVSNKKGKLQIDVPSFRASKDISIPEDIVEEVARIYGYDKLPYSLPAIQIAGVDLSREAQATRRLRQLLCYTLGYNEVYNYSWQGEEWLKRFSLTPADCLEIENYLTPEQRYLRPTLLTNLAKNLADNRRWYEEIKIMELGRVYKPKEGLFNMGGESEKPLPLQPKTVAWLRTDGTPENAFYTVKGELEYITRFFGINLDWQPLEQPWLTSGYGAKVFYQDDEIGIVGVLARSVLADVDGEQSVGLVEINWDKMLKYITDKRTYNPLPKYPVVTKDFSVVMNDNVTWRQITAAVMKLSQLIIGIELFDRFRQEGTLSVAFHVRLYDPTKTLTSEEIAGVTGLIEKELKKLNLTLK
ncbi:MAG: phenylalanine--tRNA ligase subunit beta [Candidatus Komeilibacteria bacterium]|nr:phenylalanine--tRNA ligase subunit beta [Candidatus Komeilibacteria bacterium]